MVVVAIAAVVVVVDQVTKSLAVAHLDHRVHLLGPFGLALGYNSGSAFSLFTGRSAALSVVDVVLVAGLLVAAWFARRPLVVIALGLVIGGAVGNLADRFVRGHHGDVVDFITLSHWPTFNVADACITVGVALLVVAAVLRPGSPDAPEAPEAPEAVAAGPQAEAGDG